MRAGITFDEQSGDLLVRPPHYPSYEVKEDLGGRWADDVRAWRVPPTALNVLRLVQWYGEDMLEDAPQDVIDLYREPWGFPGFTDEERARAEAHPTWRTAYPFQREGIEYMFCNPHGAALCALSWGMGKGLVSTVTADLLDARRILVLAPLSLGPTWTRETRRWSEHDRAIKRATADDRAPLDGPSVTIANHEVIQEVILRDEKGEIVKDDLMHMHAVGLSEWLKENDERTYRRYQRSFDDPEVDWTRNTALVSRWIRAGPTRVNARGKREPVRRRITQVRRDYINGAWDLVIVDESVLLKNRRAVKGDVLAQLLRRANPYVFLLSGSPTTKYRNDLWRQMALLMPRAFRSYWRFTEFFCVVDKDGWGWTIEGDRPENDPHRYLKDFMWVKSQDEALKDLPEYEPQYFDLEATAAQRRALDQLLREWVVEVEADDPDKVVADNYLAYMTRLQQITSNMGALPKPRGGFFPASGAKTDMLLQLLEEEDAKPPLLVWTWYVETTRIVYELLQRRTDLSIGIVYGSMNRDAKDSNIEAYRTGEADVLVMQMGVGKFGHTFTHTRSVYYHDRAFDSDAWVQSLARVRRIGLRHNPVLFVPKVIESADELIDANLEGKIHSIARLTNADLARLLRSLRREEAAVC